jgi:hypothetical protein
MSDGDDALEEGMFASYVSVHIQLLYFKRTFLCLLLQKQQEHYIMNKESLLVLHFCQWFK